MSGLVRPQTLRGFRDLLPAEMLLRNEAIARIRRVYESFGFAPVDTPTLESLPTLLGSGGEEADKQIFRVLNPDRPADGGEPRADLGLRFDLTVPFARLIAQYHPHEIKLPFRRYHVGPVFRADEPQPEQGRFRQFTQIDIDIAGTATVAADAEVAAVMVKAFEALGLRAAPLDEREPGFFLRINNRKLVDAFLAGLGITDGEVQRHVLRVLDKADKVSPQAIREELQDGRYDTSGDRIAGVGLTAATADAVLSFAAVREATRVKTLEALIERIAPSEQATAAVEEVRELLEHLDALDIADDAVRFDPSLARGLAYYTGSVYEGTLVGAGVGSVLGGGRYDGLVSRFVEEQVPAVGASIGLDRLVTGLRNLGIDLGTARTAAGVVVLVMPKVPAVEATRVANELRRAGLPAELYVGTHTGKVGKQLAYANAQGFRAAVMIGGNELRDGTVTVKDLRAGAEQREGITDNAEFRSTKAGQSTVARADLVATVAGILEETAEETA
jgi:histidyl-tRNA synthetase